MAEREDATSSLLPKFAESHPLHCLLTQSAQRPPRALFPERISMRYHNSTAGSSSADSRAPFAGQCHMISATPGRTQGLLSLVLVDFSGGWRGQRCLMVSLCRMRVLGGGGGEAYLGKLPSVELREGYRHERSTVKPAAPACQAPDPAPPGWCRQRRPGRRQHFRLLFNHLGACCWGQARRSSS